jgi:RES domain-containing protein
MIVYRITLVKYADKLVASGNAARWNSKDIKVIYTSGTRSLACLENVVHRSSRGLDEKFRVQVIEIPDNLKVSICDKESLMDDWQNYAHMPYTQGLGDAWVEEASAAVLKVPSVIIHEEYNYILNPAHGDFSKIKLLRNEPFQFDGRLAN